MSQQTGDQQKTADQSGPASSANAGSANTSRPLLSPRPPLSEEVLINVGPGETRVAIIEGGKPVDLIFERTMDDEKRVCTGRAGHSLIGNIFFGRVQRVLPGMQAAFVDVGLDRAGFLGAREARCLCELTGLDEGTTPPISTCVHEGQSILVQAVKDPMGEKGARLSANVTLPGRLLVLVPNQSGVALSRRIEDEDERERLDELVGRMVRKFEACGVTGEPAGFIVRTAAIDASEEEIAEDARRLAEDWARVREIQSRAAPPSIVFYDLDPVARTLRDCAGAQTKRILIDNAAAFAEAKRYCERAMPEMLDRLHLFNEPGALFVEYDIDAEIDAALDPRVELPSGGWLTIETTEALTAIDINSGKYTAATGLEETSARINVEAASVLAHQLRLRGTGGLIVIDFIHMNDPANKQKVIDALEEGFAGDRVPLQILPMSEFGLVEMTRKRVREPLEKLLTEPIITYGRVRQKTSATIANEILRAIEREARRAPGKPLSVRAAPAVVKWLLNQGAGLTDRLRTQIAGEIELTPESSYEHERFDVCTRS